MAASLAAPPYQGALLPAGDVPDSDTSSAVAQVGSPRPLRPISHAQAPLILDDVGPPKRERSYSDGDLESSGRLRWRAKHMAPCCYEKVRLLTVRARIRQAESQYIRLNEGELLAQRIAQLEDTVRRRAVAAWDLSLIHISEPTRPY